MAVKCSDSVPLKSVDFGTDPGNKEDAFIVGRRERKIVDVENRQNALVSFLGHNQ